MLTSDPTNPDIRRGPYGGDQEPVPQNPVYLVLSAAERARGFVRPVRRTYVHTVCGTATTMSQELAETFARQPDFYGNTYCVMCSMHRPVGEFTWGDDGAVVGS